MRKLGKNAVVSESFEACGAAQVHAKREREVEDCLVRKHLPHASILALEWLEFDLVLFMMTRSLLFCPRFFST